MINIQAEFWIFLCQLPMTARDAITFQMGLFDFADLIALTPAQLTTNGLSSRDLTAIRFALACEGLVMLDDDLAAIRDVISMAYGADEMTRCKNICLTATRLIDSLLSPAATDESTAGSQSDPNPHPPDPPPSD